MRVLTTPLAGITGEFATAEPTGELLGLPESRLFVIHEVLQAKKIFCLNEADRQGAADLNVKETLSDVAHLG